MFLGKMTNLTLLKEQIVYKTVTFQSHSLRAFLSPKHCGSPQRLALRGATGSSSSFQANPQNLYPWPLFSDFLVSKAVPPWITSFL